MKNSPPAPNNAAAKQAKETRRENYITVEELTANEGESHTLREPDLSQSVGDLKLWIGSALGISSHTQSIQVVFAGSIMEDASRDLASYGIQNGDTIYFIRSVAEAPPPFEPMPGPKSVPVIRTLFFKDLDGKSLTLHELLIDMKLQDVFKKLEKEKSMDVEWLRFIWSGKQLQEQKTLRDYGIMNESTIHIVGRLPGGTI